VVSTHENELTDDVDLCLPDGSRLNPAARGVGRPGLGLDRRIAGRDAGE
jgi:hypothetical protein